MMTKRTNWVLTALGLLLLCMITAYSLFKADEIVKHNIKLVSVSITANAQYAKEIKIAGSFNDWREMCCLYREKNSNKWSLNLKLRPGVYEYVLIVDGKTEVSKSEDGLQDGFGGQNHMLYVNDVPFKQGAGNV